MADRLRSAALSLQALTFAGASAGGQLIMLGVLAMLGREVGPARLGVVAVTMALGTVLTGVVDFGATSYWLRELAAGRMPAAEFRRRSGTKLVVGLTASVAMTTGALVLGPAARPFWGIGVVFFSVLVAQTMQVAVKAAERNATFSTAVLADRVAVGVAYLLLRMVPDVEPETAFYLAYLTGGAVNGWLCWRAVPREVRPSPRGFSVRSAWAGTRSFGVAALLITGQSLDTVIAAAVGGQPVAGAYGAVNRWTQPIALATNSFSILLAAVAAKARDGTDVWMRIRRSLWLPGISVGAALAMALLAEPLVITIMGEQFAESVPVLRLLCGAAALSAVSAPLLVVLQARRREKLVSTSLALAVCIQLALVAPLVARYGARGVASAALVAQVVVLGTFLLGIREPVRRILASGRCRGLLR